MITNFEKETFELKGNEKAVAEKLAAMLNTSHIGKENAIKSDEIIKLLQPGEGNIKLSGVRIRKMINYIRNSSLCKCLIASSAGYYLSIDKIEIMKYVSSLEERANEILRVRNSMIEQMNSVITNEVLDNLFCIASEVIQPEKKSNETVPLQVGNKTFNEGDLVITPVSFSVQVGHECYDVLPWKVFQLKKEHLPYIVTELIAPTALQLEKYHQQQLRQKTA